MNCNGHLRLKIALLFLGFYLAMTPSLTGQCGVLDNPQTDQSSYCPGDQMLLSIDGENLKDGTTVEWYWSLTSGFDPYNNEGTFIGSDDGDYDHCAEDPRVGSILVDGCGSGPNGETHSEYVIIESGGGLYIDNFVTTLDDTNDGPPVNLLSPGTSGCPWAEGYTSDVTGCSNVIGVGPGDFVPANSILVVQMSSDYSYTINASSLCGSDNCIYVVRSNCNRTGFGAFTNNATNSPGLRTTEFDFGCPTSSVTVIYDTDDISGAGTYVEGDGSIGSVPCAAIPSPGNITNYEIPTIFDDISETVPASWCGSTIYFKAIVEADDLDGCCSDISSDEIARTFTCPDANSAGPLDACEDTGVYTYNLTQLDATVSGGADPVSWYSDASTTSFITTPSDYQTSNSSVWAIVTSGGCDSPPEEVMLNQLSSPTANTTSITGCEILDPYDLDAEALNINSTESVTWYETDPSGGGAVQIGPPTDAVDLNPYNGGSIWAQVADGNGCTTAVEVMIAVDEAPEGCLSGDLDICESGCEEFTFSFTGGSGSYNAEVIFTFLGFSFGPFNLPAVSNSTGFTLCLDPDIILPQFPSGGITLPTCPIPIFLCLEEGDIISLELISVIDANTGCTGTVGTNCTQSIEFHSDPDIDVNQIDDTCFGETNGMIDLEISNGNPAYTFMWDNGLPSTEDQMGLGTGTYAVTVTDDLGCSATDDSTIVELDDIMLQIIKDDETCDGDDDGLLTVIPSDGVAPYSYDWDDDTYDGMDMLTGIPDGAYTVTVTDDNGCTQEETITIAPGATLVTPMFSINDTYCENDADDNLITTSDNGITGTWNPSSIDTDIVGVTAYTFTPDPNQCSQPTTLTVTVVLEPILTIFDIECDGSDYTFEVEVEGSPNTIYDLSGSSVIPPNDNSVTTNGSGFGSASYVLPNTFTGATLQVVLQSTPFCVSDIEVINAPVCECPAVNDAFEDQTLCSGDTPDLSDGTTGFSIDTDPNGFAGDLVWTTNNLDPSNGGIEYIMGPEVNESCSLTSFELYAWLECEIGGTVDSYVPSGSIIVTVNPNQPTLVINSESDPVCSGQSNVVSYYLEAADGTQCTATVELAAGDNLSCIVATETLSISMTSADIIAMLGLPNSTNCSTYIDISETVSIDVLPSGFTINTSGDGNCGDLVAELLALDGTVCQSETLPCQDATTTLDYDFTGSLGFTPSTDCVYDNLSESISCGSCGCDDPVMVFAGDDLQLCPDAGQVIDLTSFSATISGAVTDGIWSGGTGTYDSQTYSLATSYTVSQADIDAGTIMVTLMSDVPANQECVAISDALVVSFIAGPESIVVEETPCEGSGFTYESPSGMVYDVNIPNGTETLQDDLGCQYEVSVNLDFIPLPEVQVLSVDCTGNQDYSVEIAITGDLDAISHGVLMGSVIEGIPNDTPLTLTFSNGGDCTQVVTIPNPNCGCPVIDPPQSLGNVLICDGEVVPPLEVTDDNNNTVNWYSDAFGTDLVGTGLTFTPVIAGTYYAQSEDPLTGCTSTILVPVTLTVLSPSITEVVTCNLDGLTYQVEFVLTGQLPIEFTNSTGTVTDLGNNTYLIVGIDINDNVIITYNTIGVVCSDELVVMPPQCDCGQIAAPISTGDIIICEDENIPTLEVISGANQTALWYSDASLTDLVNTDDSYLPTVAGTYYVIAEENTTGCQSTDITEVTLSIVVLPTLVDVTVACRVDLSTYAVTVEYDNDQNMTFTTSAGVLTELPDAVFEISEIPIGMSISYGVASTLVNGCEQLEQLPAPNCDCPSITPPTSDQSVSYCTGEPLPTLTASVESGLTVQWYGDMLLTDLVSDNVDYTPTLPGSYYVVATDEATNCQSQATAVTLIENALPALNSFTAYCDPEDSNFYIVEFAQSTENTSTVNIGSPTTADGTFVIVDNIPINEDLTIEITNNLTNCENSVVISAPECDCTDPPQIQLTVTERICEGEEIILSATGTGFSESTWQSDGDGTFANNFDLNTVYIPGSNDITNGIVTIELVAEDPDAEGPCDEVIAAESVIITAQPSEPSVNSPYDLCKDDSVDLESLVGSGYNWYDTSLNLLNGTPQVDTEEPGQILFFISQTIDECESDLLPLTLTISEVGVNYTIPSPCDETMIGEISITELLGGGAEYTVTANSIEYLIIEDNLPQSIPYPLNTPIVLTVTSDAGCMIEIVTTEEIMSFSDTSVSIVDDLLGTNTYELGYESNLATGNVDSISWESLGDLSCLDCPDPEITVTQDVVVTLTLTTVDGCQLMDEITLIYDAPVRDVDVFIPNIFTPGKGDDNSMFYPQASLDMGTLDRLAVYDRWGTLIYQTTQQSLNDPSIGWDGTYNGSLSSQGVYVYVVEVTTLDGETLILTGDITLVR